MSPKSISLEPFDVFNVVIRDIHACDGPTYGYPKPGSRGDIYGAAPIFEINTWVPRGGELEDVVRDSITGIIRKYINGGE